MRSIIVYAEVSWRSIIDLKMKHRCIFYIRRSKINFFSMAASTWTLPYSVACADKSQRRITNGIGTGNRRVHPNAESWLRVRNRMRTGSQRADYFLFNYHYSALQSGRSWMITFSFPINRPHHQPSNHRFRSAKTPPEVDVNDSFVPASFGSVILVLLWSEEYVPRRRRMTRMPLNPKGDY